MIAAAKMKFGQRKTSLHKIVIPLKKGIHAFSTTLKDMDSRLRGNDAQALSRLFAVESKKSEHWLGGIAQASSENLKI